MDTLTLPDMTTGTTWRTLADGLAINQAAYTPQAQRVLSSEALPVMFTFCGI